MMAVSRDRERERERERQKKISKIGKKYISREREREKYREKLEKFGGKGLRVKVKRGGRGILSLEKRVYSRSRPKFGIVRTMANGLGPPGSGLGRVGM